MSIKKLFGSVEDGRNYLSDTDQKEAFKDVESERNLEQLKEKQSNFVPQVDYSDPRFFARFGSAYYYYKGAMERITDYYPYDGSDAEINGFYNKLLDVEKYIFNNLYPRTNGYVELGEATTTSLSKLSGGYATPTTKEYITLKGGPNAIDSAGSLVKASNNPYSDKFQYSNVYDTSIYTTAGLPSDYGVGTRQSNLQCNFDTGVSIEFWLKKPTFGTCPETVFDLWTSGSQSGSVDYGRITVELTGASGVSPFLLTVQSGSAVSIEPGMTAAGIFQQSIGSGITAASLDTWTHVALVMYNTGSDFASKLYINGGLNDTYVTGSTTINQLKQKDTFARIGALLTAPSGAAATADSAVADYDGINKLSASMDEFRFWKEKRSGEDIGRYWFSQVRGGTNTDISNTTLGVYYKFNEGITETSSVDSNVLDYAGRITNGVWTGYGTNSRSTGSAMIESSASAQEYKDPIIYSSHSSVSNLKSELLATGSYHDAQNNSMFRNYAPSWIIEEAEQLGNNNLDVVSHIVGTYFDRVHLLSQQVPKLRGINYTSASSEPVPFAQHLPQSLGLYTPEIFIDANVMERFLNRNNDMLFENDLDETKNLIYLNLYNNLANIFKSKGTERSLRNVLRCFNIDEQIVKINTYAKNTTFPLSNNYEQVIEKVSYANFDKKENRTAVIYQRADSTNPNSRGYIPTGSKPGSEGGTEYANYEMQYGCTIEGQIMFPHWSVDYSDNQRDYTTVSLFGGITPYTSSADGLTGADTSANYPDYTNFQVQAIKTGPNSKDVYFKLTSSAPAYGVPEQFPTLTSSVFSNVYDNTTWNLSVRVKPKLDGPITTVSGASVTQYDVIFEGINIDLGTIENSFTVGGVVSAATGSASDFLTRPKRLYVGAQRTNLTGPVVHKSDVLVGSLRYWAKALNTGSLSQHAHDIDNYGISGSYQSVAAIDTANKSADVLNLNTLALNWAFNQLSSSNSTGVFVVPDISSGSTSLATDYGPMGTITGYQHNGYGYDFPNSSTDAIEKRLTNTFKFISPERATSADAIQILSEDDKVFGITETVPNYVYTVEKSMYRAVSEEMLDFFAGVVDFNNVIGAPVNRYRGRYKSLEKLREIFFRKVTKTSQVEKFVEYYKWFDDAIGHIMAQMVPASSDFVADVYNTVESHVLERNKYQTKYPSLETKQNHPEAQMEGVGGLGITYKNYSSPVPASPRNTNQNIQYWLKKAKRSEPEITSGNPTIDTQRENMRQIINTAPRASTKPGELMTSGIAGSGTKYFQDFYPQRNYQKLYKLKSYDADASIHGGVNFSKDQNIQYTYNSLYPFGPVSTEENRFIPLNVLVGLTSDLVSIQDFEDDRELRRKVKRVFKVQSARRWYQDEGYSDVKSSMAFPFNIMSSSLNSGYNKEVQTKVGANIEITNLHNDTYGQAMGTPMQGPFTEKYVGGHQSRHITYNSGATDTYLTRPEAWKLLLGQCADQGSGAIGMASPTYPYPDIGAPPSSAYGRIDFTSNPITDNSVTISDGDTSLTFTIPFMNTYATHHADQVRSYIVIGGDNSSSYGNPTLAEPQYFDIDAGTYSCWISGSIPMTGNGNLIIMGVNHATFNFSLIDDGSTPPGSSPASKLRLTQQWLNGASAGSTVNSYWTTDNKEVPLGQWNHVAVTWDATTTGSTEPVFFVNGVQVDSSRDGSAVPTAAGSTLRLALKARSGLPSGNPKVTCLIGGYNASNAISGAMDEVSIWQLSMSADQISELYATGSVTDLMQHSVYTSNNSNLRAWYRMGDDPNDAIDGTGVYDLGTNSIVDQTGRYNGTPGEDMTVDFATNVITSSATGDNIAWTRGGNTNATAVNLTTAINAQSFNIVASNPEGDAETITVSNTKYGVPTSTKKEARGSLGNVSLSRVGSRISVEGMQGGSDPQIINFNAPRATYYREELAKRPVNIRNIQMTTGSTIIGNYQNNYEVVSTVGAFANPRDFIENQPTLPSVITTKTNLNRGGANRFTGRTGQAVLNYLTLDRASGSHYDFELDYGITDNSGSYANKSVIITRFGAPGSRETMARGYQDFKSSEFSAYNATPYRNLSVLNAGQSNEIDAQTKVGGFGYIVNDLHNRPFGLNQHLTRHTARFGRDDMAVTGTTFATDGPGASYNQLPGFHKVHRNVKRRLETIGDGSQVTASVYDNWYVRHQIPRSDMQYTWITASLVSNNDHFGYLPASYEVSTSAGYTEPYNFVSASDFGIYQYTGFGGGLWRLGATKKMVQNYYTIGVDADFLPLDFAGMNTIIYDHFSASSNVLGLRSPESVYDYNLYDPPQTRFYFNTTVITNAGLINPGIPGWLWGAPIPKGAFDARAFNLLNLHRNGPYGWPIFKQIDYNNPLTRYERRNNQISILMADSGAYGTDFKTFDLSPVSMRAHPGKINFDNNSQDMTIVASHNNARIFFKEAELNDLVNINYSDIVTPFEQMLDVTTMGDRYSTNWIMYSQQLYPSERNEFESYITKRTGYNNKFWRSTQAQRIDQAQGDGVPPLRGGTLIPNSWGCPWLAPLPDQRAAAGMYGGNYIQLTQSSWPLDPVKDFLTRPQATRHPRLGAGSPASYREGGIKFRNSGSGELQNQYIMPAFRPSYLAYVVGVGDFGSPGALYSRKQTLGSYKSVVSPYGIVLPSTGALSSALDPREQIETFAGEAVWDCPTYAGINIQTGSTFTFQSQSSDPWFSDYETFQYDLKLAAKDYSIVPEFRISEHIADFKKYGLFGAHNSDIFEIPGTGINSAKSSSFYRDYSNSEFMKGFLNIKEDSGILPREIEIECEAAIRFNPYKGFYPVQRSLDLVSQWSSSYADGITVTVDGDGTTSMGPTIGSSSFGQKLLTDMGLYIRPMIAPLFAPGILYNSIKSGMAVDYPVVTDDTKILRWPFFSASIDTSGVADTIKGPEKRDTWALTINPNTLKVSANDTNGYDGKSFFDKRLPFETMIKPEGQIDGMQFIDMESNISCSALTTASFASPAVDDNYTLMASNYFAEIGNFFLKDSHYTKLESDIIADKLKFESGSVYAARIKLKRSYIGARTYENEIDSGGFTFAANGTQGRWRLFGGAGQEIDDLPYPSGAYFPVPQDPTRQDGFRESFTLYSRPTAFGPPIAALRKTGSNAHVPNDTTVAQLETAISEQTGNYPHDSINGFNWAFTPPYYDGESWADVIFRPDSTKEYSVQDILADSKVRYWRHDAGGPHGADSLGFVGNLSGAYIGLSRGIYDGENINRNAMQISASINLFGFEQVPFTERDAFGNVVTTRDTTTGTRWVLQPKFETPHLNFNDAYNQAQMPIYGSASVPIGIWHQFGKIPTNPEVGIFLEIDDIPEQWQKYHYDMFFYDSIYNDNNAASFVAGKTPFRSLTDVFGFKSNSKSKRLGELADSQTLREAIVAIPYYTEQTPGDYNLTTENAARTQYTKKFISIPKERIQAAAEEQVGSLEGDSLDTAGSSIRKLLQKMDRYVLPPQFDFKSNKNIDPIAMYIIEFEYKLDKDDLSYIWQNMAPRDYKKLSFQKSSVAHELMDTELLSGHNILESENLRWMVFKVKQKSQAFYDDSVVAQIGQTTRDAFIQQRRRTEQGYNLNYNWPYDYVSFVEMVKVNAKVLYGGRSTGVQGERVPAGQNERVPVLETPAREGSRTLPRAAAINEQVAERVRALPRRARRRAARGARGRQATLPLADQQTRATARRQGRRRNNTNTTRRATNPTRTRRTRRGRGGGGNRGGGGRGGGGY